MFDRIIVLLLSGPDRRNPDISDLFGRLLVYPHFSCLGHFAKLRPRMPNEVLLFSDRQSLVLVEVLSEVLVEVWLQFILHNLSLVVVERMAQGNQAYALQRRCRADRLDQSQSRVLGHFAQLLGDQAR